MSWERDPLWAKARLFFQHAFEQSREDPLFGLWCSLGLELLARAAVASVSPTLLAEPDENHKFLLHALNRGSERVPKRSLGTTQVLGLCRVLFENFSESDYVATLALVNRRNDELHSGAAAFDQYPSQAWLPGFYAACSSLVKVIGESLNSLFGNEEAKVAEEILGEIRSEVKQRVLSTIAAHAKVFKAKSADDQQLATQAAKEKVPTLVHQRHHKVTCPACACDATVQGRPFGEEHVTHGEDAIIVRQSVSPRSFSCTACGLSLQGYAELHVAQLGGQYTRRTEFSPEEYYGLIDPETAYLTPYIEEYLAEMAGGSEWDNE